jgi:hypothetical protein
VGDETVQRYFSLIKKGKRVEAGWEMERVYREAQAYDRQLERQQNEVARQRKKELNHTSRIRSATGVRGISLRYKRSRKAGRLYSALSFVVSCKSLATDKPVSTSFSIAENGWEEAWKKAVHFLCKHKKMYRQRELLDRIPAQPDLDQTPLRQVESVDAVAS